MNEGEQPYEEAGYNGDANLDHGDMVSSMRCATLFFYEIELILLMLSA
jgi:hypothetical protein